MPAPGIILAGVGNQIDNDSMTFIDKMQMTRENAGVVDKLVDVKRLPNGYGLAYNEPYVGALTAVQLTDGEELNSPSPYSDTNVQVTVIEYGVQTLVSKLSNAQVKENLMALSGKLMGNALAYKLDRTGITQGQSFGGALGSGTATLVVGHLTSASATVGAGLAQSGGVARTGARSTGDPADSEKYAIIHPYQRRALAAQLSGIFSIASDATIANNQPVMSFTSNRVGLSEYQRLWIETHYKGKFDDVNVITDGNIPISSAVAIGWLAARDAIIHLKYFTPNHFEFPTVDGRAMRFTDSDVWGWGSRNDVWGVALNCACATPTS